MICTVTASLEEKIEAIRVRTPDQKMSRDGVPVSIGGTVYELKPPVRAVARRFREVQARALAALDRIEQADVEQLLGFYARQDESQDELIGIAIPELAGKSKWLDQNVTSGEIGEALALFTELISPNAPAQPRGTRPEPPND